MKKCLIIFGFCLGLASSCFAQSIVMEKQDANSFVLASANTRPVIYVDANEEVLIQKAAVLLQQDIEQVTGQKPELLNKLPSTAKTILIIGSVKSSAIRQLAQQKKINIDNIRNKWEAYQLQALAKPFKGIENALVISGNDRRGTAFGVFELSRQLGVSPWYWWADVPVRKMSTVYIKKGLAITDAPKVKYRGIFINDEAPALSGWTKEKFGGFNHLFYEKVFELMLRLKSNYIWPAMWGNAFYDDDSLNIKAADDYGIVIGTSHHEPLMRAHDEWRRYGSGKWNYDSNEVRLKEFWKGGMQRATNEKIVSVGMRGDGDEPMSRETATALLERIVKDQRKIIGEITGKLATEIPQLWALYKEVQDYYDKGMRVPDDITLLLCDDNWGNIRRLPKLNEKPRKGGYGIYYHFDYVGGPRNYKWLNTNPIPRVWEQMHLAWEYKAREIWIVNVGDIKPMEFPISFFLDYAWNPEKIQAGDLQAYTQSWAAAQFGSAYAKDIADILSTYAKYNGRRKPELLDAKTYGLYNYYQEASGVTRDYNALLKKAEDIADDLAPEYRDAYFQLILHPVKACANLQEMYYYVALNRWSYDNRASADSFSGVPIRTNEYANKVKELFAKDSLISVEYHKLNNGKWNHMMSQTHIGYTYWQQPPFNKMPDLKYVSTDSNLVESEWVWDLQRAAEIPKDTKGNVFQEAGGYVSIEADHFTKVINGNNIIWTVLPDLGRTGSAITSFPVTSPSQQPGIISPHVQYEVYTYNEGPLKIQAYFSPTLNFQHSETGLRYAISVDGEKPQVVAINKEDNQGKIWESWVANNIIIKTTEHQILKPGKHIVKYWLVDPGVVLQKLVLDFGGVEPSYLGPPETRIKR